MSATLTRPGTVDPAGSGDVAAASTSAEGPDASPVPPGPRPRVPRRSLGWWGTVFLILTEGTVFGLLLFANFYLRANSRHWPQGGIEDPELVKSGIRSVILLSSSLPVHFAEKALEQGHVARFRWWLALTFAMGAVFMVGHVMEYVELWPTFRPSTNAYGSSFYTITGLHALHLLVGLGILFYLFVQSLRGRYDDATRDHQGVTCGILYWHFVDAVWVAVFSSLYLSVTVL